MKQEVLSHFQNTGLPILALILFVAVFLSIFIWTMKKERNDLFKKTSHLPFDEARKENE